MRIHSFGARIMCRYCLSYSRPRVTALIISLRNDIRYSRSSFVPYCTSDSWSGTRAFRSPNDMFSFMGAEIVVQIIRDLVPLGLENASAFLLAGSSAGGTGVMLNLNRVHNLIHHELGMSQSIYQLLLQLNDSRHQLPIIATIFIETYVR